VGLRASVWLLIHPITPTFHLSLTHFLTTLRTHLGLPHPIIAHLFYGVNVVIPLVIYVPICFSALARVHKQQPMIHFGILFATVVLESETHVQREVFHLFLRHI
jgi:hypothetical protein